MKMTLKTVTPLWTGGTEMNMDRIHETGIIGSLRWWYAAIVRGLGGDGCTTIDSGNCQFDKKTYDTWEKKGLERTELLRKSGLCPVCQLFGATGWQRRFRLHCIPRDGQPLGPKELLNIRPHNRHRGWYLPPGWVGTLEMHILGDSDSLEKLSDLLLFLERWGGIGAKQSLGYGRFKIEQPSLTPHGKLTQRGDAKQTSHTLLPSLQDMLFYHIQFQPKTATWWREIDGISQVPRQHWDYLHKLARCGMVPMSPVVKNVWRFGQSWASSSVQDWLFGKIERQARWQSRIALGWATQTTDKLWELRGWAWLPYDTTVFHATETYHQMKTLLTDQATWSNILLGSHIQQRRITSGHEAWNEGMQTQGVAI
jgi:CRISPR-associated protein Cmr1